MSLLDTLLQAYAEKMIQDFVDPRTSEMKDIALQQAKVGLSPIARHKENIALISGDYKYSTDYNAIGESKRKLTEWGEDRLKKDKNVQPETINLLENTIGSMDTRMKTIIRFNNSLEELASIENNLDSAVGSYMNPKTPEDKSQAIDKIKAINKRRIDISNILQNTDATRYMRNNNIRDLDSNMKIFGSYAIDAIKSDEYMDNYEHKIWQDAIDNDRVEGINVYYAEKEAFKVESSRGMVETFQELAGETIQSYEIWKTSKSKKDPEDKQRTYRDDFKIKQDNLELLKKQLTESIGAGRMNTLWNQIFLDDTPWESSPPDVLPLPGEGLPGELVLLPEEDVSRFEKGFKEYTEMDWRGNLPGGKKPSFKQHDKIIFKEFEKAKERDASLTMSDFMSHRADIYNKWKEKDDTYKESKEKGEVSRLEKGRLTKEELKLWRTDLGKLKDNSLRKFFWHQGTYYGSTEQDFKSVHKKIDGKNVRFLLKRSRQGRLKVAKKLQNPYTGKFGKAIESSIEEFNKSV
jgi:hypothetical protein